jgi:hypothetical protein
LVNDLDFNVDISVDDIMALYGEKIGQLEVEKETKIPLDANAQVLDILARTPERELKMLVYINQAILNFLMSNEKILESMTDTFHDKEFFEVIL